MGKSAFITGINGQDGSYLAEFLLTKGYEVHGIVRRASVFTTKRIEHLFENPTFQTYHGDLCDSSNLNRLLKRIQPDEIYNLGAQSHVAVSFELPEYTAEVNALGAVRLLDVISDIGLETRFYQASTSELYGGLPGTEPQNEDTPFTPRSPYAAAKVYAYWLVRNYREAYGMFACNGILFNHESPRRGETFVTKKVTKAAAARHQGNTAVLTLGNLDARRDWGHAKDYVEGMWAILQHDVPDDFVLATGQTHTIRNLCEIAYSEIGCDIAWEGEGLEEKGIDRKSGDVVIAIDSRYFRPTEVDVLCGDASKAKRVLGWEPRITFEELIQTMVRYDICFDDYGGEEE